MSKLSKFVSDIVTQTDCCCKLFMIEEKVRKFDKEVVNIRNCINIKANLYAYLLVIAVCPIYDPSINIKYLVVSKDPKKLTNTNIKYIFY